MGLLSKKILSLFTFLLLGVCFEKYYLGICLKKSISCKNVIQPILNIRWFFFCGFIYSRLEKSTPKFGFHCLSLSHYFLIRFSLKVSYFKNDIYIISNKSAPLVICVSVKESINRSITRANCIKTIIDGNKLT